MLVSDMAGVVYYWKKWDKRELLLLLPPADHYQPAAVWQRVRHEGQAVLVDVNLSGTDFP